MTTEKRNGRRLRFLLVLAAGWSVAAIAMFAGPAMTASAHDYIVSTTPGDGETVTVQPKLISVTSSDKMIELGSALQVSGPAESPRFYGDGCVDISGAVASMPAQLGAPGMYTVKWRVTSADGHPIDGSYSFDWAPDTGTELAEGVSVAPNCGGDAATGSGSDENGQQSASETGGNSGSASGAPGDGTELLWILGGIAVVIVGGAAAWVFVRRLSDGPPSE